MGITTVLSNVQENFPSGVIAQVPFAMPPRSPTTENWLFVWRTMSCQIVPSPFRATMLVSLHSGTPHSGVSNAPPVHAQFPSGTASQTPSESFRSVVGSGGGGAQACRALRPDLPRSSCSGRLRIRRAADACPKHISGQPQRQARIVPVPAEASSPSEQAAESEPKPHRHGCRYWPWSELMRRTFSLDVLACPRCGGRLRLSAMMTEPKEIARYLRALGEPTEVPARTPARGPPYWRSRVLRRQAGVDDAA
jgi:hypothetical protein